MVCLFSSFSAVRKNFAALGKKPLPMGTLVRRVASPPSRWQALFLWQLQNAGQKSNEKQIGLLAPEKRSQRTVLHECVEKERKRALVLSA
jgi:hypothetical protein